MPTSQHDLGPDFDAQMRRLKASLKLKEDQQVAEALGLTKAALSVRKRRNAFPRSNLVALAAQRPDLELDVVYIVSGVPSQDLAKPGRDAAAVTMLGNLPMGTMEAQELVVDMAIQMAEERRRLRLSRGPVYEDILGALDRSTDHTVAAVKVVAERMAKADEAEEAAKAAGRKRGKGAG